MSAFFKQVWNTKKSDKVQKNYDNNVEKVFNYIAKIQHQEMEELPKIEAIKFIKSITKKENLNI